MTLRQFVAGVAILVIALILVFGLGTALEHWAGLSEVE